LSIHQDLIKSLTETAQQHKAMLPVLKTSEAKPEKLPVMMSFAQMGKSLQAIDVRDAGEYVQAAQDTQLAENSQEGDQHFILLDDAKNPIKNRLYRIHLADSIVEGRSDDEGRSVPICLNNKPRFLSGNIRGLNKCRVIHRACLWTRARTDKRRT
jgi:hypothetical protein